MTSDEYRTIIRQWGFTPVPGGRFGNEVLHQGPNGEFTRITDPETLLPEEREAMIDRYRKRLGIQNH